MAQAYAYRSVGAWADGTGTITPALPAGWAVGDLLVMPAWARTNTETMTTPPTGWTDLATHVDVTWNFFYGRIAQSGDTAPSLTWSGTNDHRAQIAAFSGDVWQGGLASIVHAANDKYLPGAQNDILYDALTIALAECLCFATAVKNKTVTSDGTTFNNLATWNQIAQETLAGSDMATWWGYKQQTTAANLPAATQTRTGTAEALQYGTMYLALKTQPVSAGGAPGASRVREMMTNQ